MIENKMIPILDIDINGAEKLLETYPDANTIFLFPPSISDLKTRLMRRGTETKESLALRLSNAHVELTRGLESDEIIGFRLLNKDLKDSIAAFLKLVENIYPNL
jgi:guanylate kinase